MDMTEEGELVPYDRLLPTNATHHRFPIRDVSAPKSIDEAKQIVDYILSFATKGQYGDVYVHCWGGVGRTGTIVACVIAEQMAEEISAR